MSLYLIPHVTKKDKFCQWYLATNELIGYKAEFHYNSWKLNINKRSMKMFHENSEGKQN